MRSILLVVLQLALDSADAFYVIDLNARFRWLKAIAPNEETVIDFVYYRRFIDYLNNIMNSSTPPGDDTQSKRYHFRFHLPYAHLSSVFGDDWFALKAERFARFFGTPTFLVGQTVIVAVWIGINVAGFTKFDVYPFILLNLAFSLQAAYAAPLILLAQTRQADRDKVNNDADARHREDIATANEQRQLLTVKQTEQLVVLLEQNTALTEITRQMSERIEALTVELRDRLAQPAHKP